MPPTPQQAPKPGEPRYHALDALRGLAALTVVFHHFALLWTPAAGRPRWATLLNPFTDGLEAVMLFFLLSGFVLSVPGLRGKSQPYPVYLLRRILRLYGPYLLALGLALAAAWHWGGTPNLNPADPAWLNPIDRSLVLQHILFLGHYDTSAYNNAFWSLVIEMRISLIFPLLFLLFRRLRPRIAIPIALACTVLAFRTMQVGDTVGQVGGMLLYSTVFMAGITLAAHLSAVNDWFARLSSVARAAFALGSFITYTWGSHFVFYLRRWLPLHTFPIDLWVVTAGAAGYMILAINHPGIRRFLDARIPQFLGRISYSLYLTHEVVLYGLAHQFGRRLPLVPQLLVYTILSIALGYLFCIAVEEPILRLGRRVGTRKPSAVLVS